MASPGNWMHLQYQSKLQARKALSKDGKVFGDTIMVGVKPCIDKASAVYNQRVYHVCDYQVMFNIALPHHISSERDGQQRCSFFPSL